MNHSGAFWKVKNQYSDELRELWARGYTGEGMWSRGRTLLSGEYVSAGLGADDILPEHLCGGTFRSSGKRKRAAKPRLSWRELKERRIKRKFGVDGKTLGADDAVKSELEQGKKPKGKPRVAGSNRGRELRAAAALARFETKKEEDSQSDVKDENDVSTDSGSETEGEDNIKTEPGEAHDLDGSTLHDRKGRTMVKVCDDEEKDDVNVKNEMHELDELRHIPEKQSGIEIDSDFDGSSPKSTPKGKCKRHASLMMNFGRDEEPSLLRNGEEQDGSKTEGTASEAEISEQREYSKSKTEPTKQRHVPRAVAKPLDGSETESDMEQKTPRKPTESFVSPKPKSKGAPAELAKARTEEFFGGAARSGLKENAAPNAAKLRQDTPEVAFNPPCNIQSHAAAASPSATPAPAPAPDPNFPMVLVCPVCSVENDLDAATCMVCGNVLDEAQVEGTWKCQSDVCKGSEYVNADDYGVCHVCRRSRG